MQPKNIFFILGLLTVCMAISLSAPIIVSIVYEEYETLYLFLKCFGATALIGALLAFAAKPAKNEKIHLTSREGVAIVGLCWILATLISSLPYIFIADKPLAHAVFESASGLSTTGASIFTDLEILPKSLLFWRSFTQWFGGLGIIVFSLAILPFIGAGGMQLYKAEVTGVSKDKVAPKMIDTARSLWSVYIILTVTLTVILYLQGMTFFDAINHSMATLATGGFSTKNASVSEFSPMIQWTIIVFMYLGSVNFTLHFLFLHKNFGAYVKNEEFVYYSLFLLAGILIMAGCLYFGSVPAQSLLNEEPSAYTVERALRDSAFQLISLTTTTGFATADYMKWPIFLQILILTYMMIGGCAGSTSGGMKFIRIIILFKMFRNELNRLSHPRLIERIKINRQSIDDTAIKGTLIYFGLYFVSMFIGSLILCAHGLDFDTALSAVITSISNVGPALNHLGPAYNFSSLGSFELYVLSAFMIYGRLEMFTVLLLFMPKFWRS